MDSIKLFSSKSNRGRRVAEINRRRAAARQGGIPNNPLAEPNGSVNAAPQSRPAGPTGNVTGHTNKNNANNISSNNLKRKKRNKSALKTALIVIMILVLGFATLFVTLGFYVSSLDSIFPNVYVHGVRLSGMTVSEASDTLGGMVDSTDLESLSVTVSFTSGGTFVITGGEAGLSFGDDVFDSDAMAHELFAIGRTGNFLQNELSFIRSLFEITDVSIADFESIGSLTFDEEAVRAIVNEQTLEFNSSLIEDAVTINSDSITIVKGSRFDYAEPNDVFELVVNSLITAVSEQRDVDVEYTPIEIEGDDVDFALLYSMVSVEPVNSVYDPVTQSATMSSYGVSFDIEAARSALNSAQVGDEIVIPFVQVPPEITQEYLDGLLFRDVLAEITTNMAGPTNRLHNIGLTVESIHGTILNPDDVFSFNEVVGQRSAARGFRPAGGFVGGRLVDVLGGGICQTSSTLYVLTLKANLEVVSRTPHGMTIAYLPYGQDATVVFANDTDYRFRNSSDFPIKIELETSGRNFTGRILGTRLEDYRIELETRIISQTPIQVVRQETEGIFEEVTDRAGSAGVVADVYKRFYDSNDNFLREELVGRTTYHMRTRIILVPMPGAQPPPPPDLPPDPPPPPPPDPLPPDPTPQPPPDPPPDPGGDQGEEAHGPDG